MAFDITKYEYEKGGFYKAFKSAVDEKICATMVSETLADSLRKEGLVYNTQGSIPVADIGCGPADSIQMYLEGARHQGGFNLHVTDYNDEYTGPKGMAHKNLTVAKSQGRIKINDFSVTNGQAAKTPLNDIMGTEPNHFPIAFISHMLYHMKPESVAPLLKDLASNVLREDGVGVLFHLEQTDNPKSFQYFRAKYGKPSPKDMRNIPATEVENPPKLVEDACAAQNIPCHTMHYNNNYYFAPMKEECWEMLKDPQQYETLEKKYPQAYENLLKLYFIPQRAANEFAADNGPNGLSAFIDEVRQVIAPNQAKFEKDGGFMNLAETVQILGSTHATEATREKLARVSAAIQQQLPELTQEAFAAWDRNRSVQAAGAAG